MEYWLDKKEMNKMKKYSILQQIGLIFECYVPCLCLFISILTYIVIDIYHLFESLLLMYRIKKFMIHTKIEKSEKKTQIGSFEVILKNVTANWSDESKQNTHSNSGEDRLWQKQFTTSNILKIATEERLF
ncbi:putative multidrug resistance-associated protein lethal(2)03659 isoform X1 [Vespula squamosa]|uniref:Multidrug resistance-associated protein lethal(2)03659 isoform X1 n=1 Tax=Vespula squamosa TaxID=30214 RepID=A0ABD2BG51_VESSQ